MMNDKQQNLDSQNSTESDSDFEARIKESLDVGAKQIDYQTQHRLQSIRKFALDHLPSGKAKEAIWYRLGNTAIAHWQPTLAGFVFCSIALLLLFTPMRHHLLPPDKISTQPASIVDFLDSPDDLDVLGDPGFYVWVNELDSEKTSAHAS